MSEQTSPDLSAILQSLLQKMELDATVQPKLEGEVLRLIVDGPDAEKARGKKGEVLDALQYILGKVLGNAGRTEQRLLLDIGDFRAGREDSIKEVGRFLANKVLALQKTISLYPMSSADRKVVHAVIAEDARLSSQSEGDGMARRLFIIPGPKPARPPRREFDDRRPREDRPREDRPPRSDRGAPREGRRDDRPRDDRPRDDRPPRREFDDRRRDDRPRDDRPREGRPPRRNFEEAPPLGTPENPYIMEPPKEPTEE